MICCADCGVEFSEFTVFTLLGSRAVRWRPLEQLSHEGEAVLPDVRLPGEGVEDGVGTAADEGQSRGHRTAGLGDMVQSADE